MSAPSLPAPARPWRGAATHFWLVLLATAWSYTKRSSAYWIDLVRWPLYPLILYAIWRLSYHAAGRDAIDGVNAAGFLLVGVCGVIVWTSTIWSSGYAIEYEREEGTIGALFLTPASRAAIIAGYGLGSLARLLSSLVAVVLLAAVSGARLAIGDPLAAGLAIVALLAASLGSGFAFAPLFILSRRANLLANFLQAPIYLLAGFAVPRDALPGWLQTLSNLLPIGHAADALRATLLRGASLHAVGGALAAALGLSALYTAIGLLSLRKVEHAARRAGDLELY